MGMTFIADRPTVVYTFKGEAYFTGTSSFTGEYPALGFTPPNNFYPKALFKSVRGVSFAVTPGYVIDYDSTNITFRIYLSGGREIDTGVDVNLTGVFTKAEGQGIEPALFSDTSIQEPTVEKSISTTP